METGQTLKILPAALRGHASQWMNDTPIRSELFSGQRLQEHARSLALNQATGTMAPMKPSLIARLRQNESTLSSAYRELLNAADDGETVTPAAEWLIDNYHVIEQHIHQAIIDLPAGFYRQLPKLLDGHLAGLPQVFGIVWAYAAHTDSRFEGDELIEFINAYQEIQPLTIGELWALAIHLRMILIENAARVASRTVVSRRARLTADALSDTLIDGDTSTSELLQHAKTLVPHAQLSFMVHLIKRLREDREVAPSVINRLRQAVHDEGYDFDSAVQEEHTRQAANNVTMQNIFTSLRRISDFNWEDWFEHVSLVDRILKNSPDYLKLNELDA